MKKIAALILIALIPFSSPAQISSETAKLPVIKHEGTPEPTGPVEEKKEAMKLNVATYIRMYNDQFKKLNGIETDIIDPEQLTYIKDVFTQYPDGFYNRPWAQIIVDLNKLVDELVKARYDSYEYKSMLNLSKKAEDLDKKLKEYQSIKGSLNGNISIAERLESNERNMNRNNTIMWAAIILAAIYLFFFVRRKQV